MNVMVKPRKTPWLHGNAPKTYSQEKEEPSVYADIAASPPMSVLNSPRAAKSD